MAAKKPVGQFIIAAKVMVDTNIVVNAESLADAVEKSKDFTVTDFVNILGDHNDSSIRITGVFDY